MHDNSSPSHDQGLSALGFQPHFSQLCALYAAPEAFPARVARVDAQGCTVLAPGEDGRPTSMRARVPKRLGRKRPPVVGDWVLVRAERGELSLRKILDRSTSLTRRAAGGDGRGQVLAANLDRVVITSGLDRDFNLGRLERWLSLVHEGGARPLVALTKAGLVDEAERARRVEEAQAVALGVEVLAVDVLAGVGVEALEEALRSPSPWAQTLAFVGSSGVGKSTLINHFSRRRGAQGERGEPGEDMGMATGSVSEAHGKGRHTTSHRELFALSGAGLLVIDTPGLREVGLWGAGEGVERTFAEIVALARSCRFGDCGHGGEPGCAVRAAIATGELDARRLEAYARLHDEREATARRASEHERRSDERSFAKHVRRTITAKERKRRG